MKSAWNCLLHSQIGKGWPNSRKAVAPELASYFAVHHELAVDSARVLRATRLIVPPSLRTKVVNLAHESHQGIVRMKQRLRDRYCWPQMDSLVQSIISSRLSCKLSKYTDPMLIREKIGPGTYVLSDGKN